MADILAPRDAQELAEAVAWAAGGGTPLAIQGGASKAGLGRPVEAAHLLNLSALSGISFYEPEELVISAMAGTPLAQVIDTLAQGGQEMCFEPADYGPVLGAGAGQGTIGGVFACNVSGPRRVKSGAARDFLLGAKGVNGRGESFKCGGRVMKNVTGYDLCKLLAGSYGTLAVLSEVTFKVLPLPAETHTLLVYGLDADAAVRTMTEALKSPYEVYGAAHVPAGAAARSKLAALRVPGKSVTALRIEGPDASIRYCRGKLTGMVRARGQIGGLGETESQDFWRELRDLSYFLPLADRMIWRLSVTPSAGAAAAREIQSALDTEALFDWGGGLVWLAAPPPADVSEALESARTVRAAVARVGGHATLMRAPEDVRTAVPVFPPQDEATAGLTRRLKDGFDPRRILNPGRMYDGI